MKNGILLLGALLASTSCFAVLRCDLKTISSGAVLETNQTNAGIVIFRILGDKKYLYAAYNDDTQEGPVGYMAAIYDSSVRTPQNPAAKLVDGSFGNKAGQAFSVRDASLDLDVDCVAE